MLRLARPELLGADQQFPGRFQSVTVELYRPHPALRLALLQMDLARQEVNSLYLKIPYLHTSHSGLVLQDGSVVGHSPLRTRLRGVDECDLLLCRQSASCL